ncbi:uncharacterized protein LOC134203999 [Armigeres subalbatus]|uniref:uncharacterized protein LOC134203999 n=1 Tax=Armigeres subalbatus TaxID=124917 RepID=UPI002ED57AB0
MSASVMNSRYETKNYSLHSTQIRVAISAKMVPMCTQMETFPPLKRSSGWCRGCRASTKIRQSRWCRSHLRAPGKGLSQVNSVSYCDQSRSQVLTKLSNKHKVMIKVHAELEDHRRYIVSFLLTKKMNLSRTKSLSSRMMMILSTTNYISYVNS